MLFFGEYEHTIDAKGRLAIPAEAREAIEREKVGPALVLAPGPNGSLWLWPEKTFATIAKSFGGSILPDAHVAKFERQLFSQTARVELDSAGRIRVPERHRQKYGLQSQVVVIGVGQHMELMDAEAWRQQSEADATSAMDIWEQARLHLEARETGSAGKS